VYAVHWLRDKAITAGVTVRSTGEADAYRELFPWGVFLNALPEWASVSLGSDEMTALLIGLRKYTSSELPLLGLPVSDSGDVDFPRIREFVSEGLRQSLPLGKFERVNSEWATQLLTMCAWRKAIPDSPVIALLLGGITGQVLNMTLPAHWFLDADCRVHRVIRRLRYPLSRLRLFREHEAAIQSFCQAKGWTKRVVSPISDL